MKNKESGAKKRYTVIQLVLALAAITSLVFLASELNSNKRIKDIRIEGANIVPDSIIECICRPVIDSAGENLKLEDVRAAVMRNPFIKNAVVTREGSQKISVEISEREPVAIVADTNGTLSYIDGDGYRLPYEYEDKRPDFIVIRGISPAKSDSKFRSQVLGVLHELKKPGRENLYYSISEIIYDRESGDISLISSGFGLKIIFGGANDSEEKIKKLLSFWANEMVNEDIKGIKYIDLRWSGQVVLSYS